MSLTFNLCSCSCANVFHTCTLVAQGLSIGHRIPSLESCWRLYRSPQASFLKCPEPTACNGWNMWPRFRCHHDSALVAAFIKIKHQEVHVNASLEKGRCLFVKGHRLFLRLFFLQGETKHNYDWLSSFNDWTLRPPLADLRQACKRSTTYCSLCFDGGLERTHN